MKITLRDNEGHVIREIEIETQSDTPAEVRELVSRPEIWTTFDRGSQRFKCNACHSLSNVRSYSGIHHMPNCLIKQLIDLTTGKGDSQ